MVKRAAVQSHPTNRLLRQSDAINNLLSKTKDIVLEFARRASAEPPVGDSWAEPGHQNPNSNRIKVKARNSTVKEKTTTKENRRRMKGIIPKLIQKILSKN